MITQHWGRVLRQRVAPFIPERLKAPLRPRLFGYRPSSLALPMAFSREERGPNVTIDGRTTIRYRDEDTRDFHYHLADNGESVEEMASFLDLAASARTFFDVGAWRGLFSLAFCSLEPDAAVRKVVAYEPSSSGITAMRSLALLNDCASRLLIRPVGVGLSAGRASARVAPGGIVSVDADAGCGDAIDAIQIVSLDEEIRALDVVPDLVKIDVEGYEYEVIAGARRLLSEHKPAICLELHLDLLERRGRSAAQVIGELETHGYRFQSCAGESLSSSAIVNSFHAVRRLVAL